MNVTMKFKGSIKTKAVWTQMGKTYSYILIPEDTVEVPEDQIKNIQGFGSFTIVKGVDPIKDVEPIIEEESSAVITKIDEAVFDEQVVVEEVEEEEEVVVVVEEVKVNPFEKYESDVSETQAPVEELEVEESPEHDYTSYSKTKLRGMCKERNLKKSGNRDDLIYRLVQSDVDNN
jgi:hypothetical protein